MKNLKGFYVTLALAVVSFVSTEAFSQPFPSPTFQNLTVLGTCTGCGGGGGGGITGSASGTLMISPGVTGTATGLSPSNGNIPYVSGGVWGGTNLSAILDAQIGSTQGGLMYRGASTWTYLAPGVSGQFLQTLGSSANPNWANGSGSTSPGGSNTQVNYNNSNVFGGSSGLTLSATKVLSASIGLGSDATGDIYYNSGSGTLARLGIGSPGNVLTVASGLPSWIAPSGGGNTTSTTLSNNVLPKANGANSIINSSVTDNGTAVNTTEAFSQSGVKVPVWVPIPLGWVAGQNPDGGTLISVIPINMTISAIKGRVETAEGSAGRVDVYATSGGTACASGTDLTNTTGLNINAQGDQTLSGSTTSLTAGQSLCLHTISGTFTTNKATITVYASPT